MLFQMKPGGGRQRRKTTSRRNSVLDQYTYPLLSLHHCTSSIVWAMLHRSPRQPAPSGERSGDRSTKKHRQRASHGKKDKCEDTTTVSTSSRNKRHSAPLPADSSHQSPVNSSLNNLSHSTLSTDVSRQVRK